MKILVVGGSGTIGKSVVKELSLRHEIITASRNKGDIFVDLEDLNSIKKVYDLVNNIDAVIVASGKVHFGLLSDMNNSYYEIGIKNKLLGQVNIVLEGIKHLNDNGSFSLISGILNREPILLGNSAAMVNGAIDAFVKSAALELPRGLRINAISPTVITEAMDLYAPYFRGFKSVPAHDAALAFSKSVEGASTGQVYIVE